LAKNVFELHGVDEHKQRVLSKTVRHGNLLETFAHLPPCAVGMEACGGAHYWARELRRLGHASRLRAPQFVAPHHKNDRNDAAAICEALGRSTMRIVPIKEVAPRKVRNIFGHYLYGFTCSTAGTTRS
jgi:transposase